MKTPLKIALVGDHDPAIAAHRAIPLALDRASGDLGLPVTATWIDTIEIGDAAARLRGFDALWLVPGSPYRSMDGALRAVRHARETRLPFLGTCAGFQHAVIDHARHGLGWPDADHAETAPEAPRAVITPLACGLVEALEPIRFVAGSRIAAIYGQPSAVERYRCRYGLNPAFAEALLGGPMRIAATGDRGEVRAVELDDHPFFIATLFQPERGALEGATPRLVRALIQAAQAARVAAAASKESPCC
jgi:CTP synthase (UTP-ammonia lyase)